MEESIEGQDSKGEVKLQNDSNDCLSLEESKKDVDETKTEHKQSSSLQPFDILNLLNENSKKTRDRLGPFIYRKRPRANLQFRDIVVLENDFKYLGQWKVETNLKEGVGILAWTDGSIYEGYWKNDMANGKGRLIHAGGGVYEGDWINDKKNGNGVYIHADLSKFVGNWFDDRQN